MSKYNKAKIILLTVLGLAVVSFILPLVYRLEDKLTQTVECVKQVCVEDDLIEECLIVTPQVGRYIIVKDADGSKIKIKLTGERCY